MPFGYIYKIVFPNGKHYIGLTTTSLEQRTKEHKCCAKSGNTKILYKALRKYDMIDTLELIKIDTANTAEKLCEKEIGYVLIYNSYYMNGNGYNMTFGGEGTNGYVHTEEDRQKAREKSTKQWENPEVRKEHGEKIKKYYEEHPEARQKLSDGKGKNNPFDVFKTDGTFIKTFTYQFDAKEYLQKEYNITSTLKISAVLAGNRKSSSGFVFKYK